MNILLLSWGTMGDFMPFAVLAHELERRGHTVRLGGPSLFEPLAREQRLRFAALGSPVAAQGFDDLMARMRAQPNPRKQLQMLLHEGMVADLDRQYRDALVLLDGADLVLCHWLHVAGMMAAEKAGVARATLTLNPVGVGCMAEADAAARQAGPAGRRNVARELADLVWGDGVQAFRARAGLPALESVSEYQYATALSLVAISPQLLPEGAAWPARHRVLGFFASPVPVDWEPDAALASFVAPGGPPVVVFCFGSMSAPDAHATAQLVSGCAQSLGIRAVLQAGWGPQAQELRCAHLLPVGYVPHAWLFARAACVVHHGGAGTTAAALRAGVPSVVAWHLLDQAYWGTTLTTLGLGPRAIPREKLCAASLQDAIRAALDTPSYAQGCRRVAQAMAHEPGVTAAADLLLDLAAAAHAA